MKKVNTEAQYTYPVDRGTKHVSDDIFGLYLHDSRRQGRIEEEELKLLSKTVRYGIDAQSKLDGDPTISDEEREMLSQASQAGLLARNRIVETNTGLVHMWANRNRGRGVPFMDLIQVGNMGLIHAAEMFDPDLGFTFGTYATRWIRSYVAKAVHQHGRMIAIPVEESQSLQKINRIKLEHRTLTGQEPSIEEIAKAAGYNEAKVKKLLSMEIPVDPLEREVDGKMVNILDHLPPEYNCESIEDQVLDDLMLRSVQQAVRKLLMNTKLSDEKLEVVRMKIGIGYEDPMTDMQIGKAIGRSRKTVGLYFEQAKKLLELEAREAGISRLIEY